MLKLFEPKSLNKDISISFSPRRSEGVTGTSKCRNLGPQLSLSPGGEGSQLDRAGPRGLGCTPPWPGGASSQRNFQFRLTHQRLTPPQDQGRGISGPGGQDQGPDIYRQSPGTGQVAWVWGGHPPVEDGGAVGAHGRVAVEREQHVTLSAELAHKALGLAPLGTGWQVRACSRGASGLLPDPPTCPAAGPTSQSSLMCLAKSVWVSASEQPRRPECVSSRSCTEYISSFSTKCCRSWSCGPSGVSPRAGQGLPRPTAASAWGLRPCARAPALLTLATHPTTPPGAASLCPARGPRSAHCPRPARPQRSPRECLLNG